MMREEKKEQIIKRVLLYRKGSLLYNSVAVVWCRTKMNQFAPLTAPVCSAGSGSVQPMFSLTGSSSDLAILPFCTCLNSREPV